MQLTYQKSNFVYLSKRELEKLEGKEVVFLTFGDSIKVSRVIKVGQELFLDWCGLVVADTIKILHPEIGI